MLFVGGFSIWKKGLESHSWNPLAHAEGDDTLQMFVIDVLRHGQGGQLVSVLDRLNDRGCIGWRDHWPHDFTATEVVAILRDLASRGIIEVSVIEEGDSTWSRVEPTDQLFKHRLDDLWFFMTESAYDLWDRWTPPSEPSD